MMRTDLDAQAMQQALEPCPFCGKSDTAKLVAASEMYAPDYEDAIYPHSESYAVVCDASAPKGPGGCGGMGGFKLRKEDAIEAWNRRAALQSRLAAPVGDATPAYELRKAACDLVTKMQAEGFPMMCMDGTPNAVGIILEAWATNPAPDAVRRETVEAKLDEAADKALAFASKYSDLLQAVTDPENQPSQFGTVTIEHMEKGLSALQEKVLKACVAECDEIASVHWEAYHAARSSHTEGIADGAGYCAAAIRAMLKGDGQ